ncbi:MAG: outer membrane lipoprotein-sorting protein [Fidelibacterota bacterium]|nr:MAG: outer membrane lipoprotein-sorting protein [Candidatus Neomarinimicrobiota bacterium]
MNIKVRLRKTFFTASTALLMLTGWLHAQIPTAEEILEKATELMNVTNSKSVMSQTIQTSSGQLRTFEMESFSANKGENTLIRYTAPVSVRGQAFLMLNNANDIWTYFPRTGRVRKLASHAKKQNVQGSDFTYEDMGSGDTWREDYQSTNLGEAELLDEPCWKLQLDGIAEQEPAYHRMIVWVRQKDYYPLQIDYYDDGMEVLKSLYLEDVRDIEGTPTAMLMTMCNHEDGTETRMETLAITYSWEPPKAFFTERNLKK